MTRDERDVFLRWVIESGSLPTLGEHVRSLLTERDTLAAQVETLRAEQSKLWKEGWLKGLSQCGIRSDPERAWREREEQREERELQAAAPLPSTGATLLDRFNDACRTASSNAMSVSDVMDALAEVKALGAIPVLIEGGGQAASDRGAAMPLTDQDKADLRALLQRATPAIHWTVDRGISEDPDGDDDVAYARGPLIRRGSGDGWNGPWMQQATSDAELICWLVNHAASLLEE